jgi:hypothetical protein
MLKKLLRNLPLHITRGSVDLNNRGPIDLDTCRPWKGRKRTLIAGIRPRSDSEPGLRKESLSEALIGNVLPSLVEKKNMDDILWMDFVKTRRERLKHLQDFDEHQQHSHIDTYCPKECRNVGVKGTNAI